MHGCRRDMYSSTLDNQIWDVTNRVLNRIEKQDDVIFNSPSFPFGKYASK